MSETYSSKYSSEKTNKVHICVYMYVLHTYRMKDIYSKANVL